MQDFVYTTAHLKALKKYKFLKTLFLLLGCLVLLLQSIAWLIVWYKDIYVDTTNKVFVTVTLVCSLLFIISQCAFIYRTKKIINAVNQKGSYETRRFKLRIANKPTLSGAIILFYRLLALVVAILLGVLVVSFIQNYLNWGKVILKMPIIALLAIGLLNVSAEYKYNAVIEKSNK